MASVSGEIKAGEAAAAAAKVRYHQLGTVVWLVVWCVLSWAAGWGLVFALQTLLHWEADYSGIGILIGGIGFALVVRRYNVGRFRKQLAKRAIADTFHSRIEIAPDAITHEIGDVLTVSKWRAVTEVFPAKGYWVFLIQAAPLYVPRRFFADEAQERAFLTEALSYMNEAARSRSKDAQKFAEKTAA